jgi:hypothetical protein
MKLVPPGNRNAVSVWRLILALAVAVLVPPVLYGSPPSWWSQRGVVEDQTADDYAPVNQGQLKNIAKAAVAEMDAKLPGGAGETLHRLIASWSGSGAERNDFAAINLGQLKKVAKPFYDRLIAAGLASQYPWADTSNQPDDFAIANVGQVKNLFSFELPAIDPLYDGDHNGFLTNGSDNILAQLESTQMRIPLAKGLAICRNISMEPIRLISSTVC